MNAQPKTDQDRFVDRFYDDYLSFKPDWTGEPSEDFAAYFDCLAPLAALPQGADMLEIGFGDGQFLTWSRRKGHRVVGMEIQPELLKRANAQGFVTIEGPLQPKSLAGRSFDCICAFDVLEHLTVREISELLETARDHLKPGGFCLFRFPNAASPFGMVYQHGDVTHKTPLSVSVIGQLARGAGLQSVETLRPRPYPKGAAAKLKRFAGYALQDMIESVVARAYFGGGAHLSPNALVVIRP